MAARLILVGDTNLRKMTAESRPFERVKALLESADVRFCNNENCYSDPDVALPYKAGWYHTDRSCADLLTDAGFDAVGCANNVTFGEDAIRDSLAQLDRAGVKHTGAGPNKPAARAPAIVEFDGVRLGFLSYTSVYQPIGHAATDDRAGVATIRAHTAYRPHRRVLEMPGVPPEIETWVDAKELRELKQDVATLRSKVDLVVLSCHWGVSSSTETLDYQREIAAAAVESGADVVMGHHPHVIQGVEVIAGKPIFYSLGNFVFGWEKMQSRHRAGMAVLCEVSDGGLQKVDVRPMWRDDSGRVFPAEVDSDEGVTILSDVKNRSNRFSTKFDTVEHGRTVILA